MTIASLMGISGNDHINELDSQIGDDIAFYDEHTFGAAESITDPLCENSVVQLGQKESYVWSAVKKNRILREEVMGRIQPFLPVLNSPSVTLFNTLGWNRTGCAMVYIDHQLLPKDRKFTITGPSGAMMPVQLVTTREEGTWWMLEVPEIPALGFSNYRINVVQEPRQVAGGMLFTGDFENRFYRVKFDRSSGRITSLYDKEWRHELIDPASEYSTGEVIYERLGKNREQISQMRLDEYTRVGWKNIRISGITPGPVFQSLTVSGDLPGCAQERVTCEIRLYNDIKKLEFCYAMKKLQVTDPEGVYVAFPFRLNGGHHVLEVAGGTMIPGKQQLEGSATDWTGIQDYAAVRSDSGQIVFVSPEIPLVEPGGINLGKFGKRVDDTPGLSIFSWVLNNYWTTNFLASQQGELKWTYQITSGADPSNTLAKHFGMECRIPVLPRVLPASAKEDGFVSWSFFPTGKNNFILVSSTPSKDGKTIIYQLREAEGKPGSLLLPENLNITGIEEVDVLGEPLKKLSTDTSEPVVKSDRFKVDYRPFETKFLKMEIKK